jgi:membrane protein implicated in regulation of membrane protease activity
MIFNRYSFVWVAGFGIVVAGLLMWRAQRFPIWLRIGTPLVLALLAVALWWVLRPSSSPEVRTLADAERLIGSGKPIVIEFLSEY